MCSWVLWRERIEHYDSVKSMQSVGPTGVGPFKQTIWLGSKQPSTTLYNVIAELSQTDLSPLHAKTEIFDLLRVHMCTLIQPCTHVKCIAKWT